MNRLKPLVAPQHIALIGASERAQTEAAAITENMLAHAGDIKISLVNPRHPQIFSRPALESIGAIEGPIDLAVVLAPWAAVPNIIDQLGARACRLAVVMSRPLATFFSPNDDPRGLKKLKARAASAGVRLLGPAAAGLLAPHIGLNASRLQTTLAPGSVALVTASHALFHLALDHAAHGFSCALDLGACLDVGWADAIDFLARHERTRSLKLATPSMNLNRSAISALRALSAHKPVLVLNAPDPERPLAQALYQACFDRLGIASTASFSDWIAYQAPLGLARAPTYAQLSNSTALAALGDTLGRVECTDRAGALSLADWLALAGKIETPGMVVIDASLEVDREQIEGMLKALAPDGFPPLAWCGIHEDRTRTELRAAGLLVYADPQSAKAAIGLSALSIAARTDAKLTPPPLKLILPWNIAALALSGQRSGRLAERDLRQALEKLNIALLDDPEATALALDVEWAIDDAFGPYLALSRGEHRQYALLPMDLKGIESLLARFTRVHDLNLRWLRDALYVLNEVFLATENLTQLKLDGASFNPLGIRASKTYALRGRRSAQPLIAPYPTALEELIDPELKIRPIRGEDEAELSRGFNRLSPEDVRMRFHYPLKALTHDLAAQLSQIDYDRQMAFILTTYQAPGLAPIFGVARMSADPFEGDAEFAIVIGRDYSGRGFGRKLMQKLIDHARARRLNALWGDVLNDNQSMLGLATAMGFRSEAHPGDAGLRRVVLRL